MLNSFFPAYQKYVGIINYVAFLALIFTLPLPWSFTQPLFVIWGISWLLEARWVQSNHWHKPVNWPYLLIVLLLIWCAISLLWTSNLDQGLTDFSKYIMILAAVLISGCGVNNCYQPVKIKISLYVGCLISLLAYCLVMMSAYRMRLIEQPSTPLHISVWELLGSRPVDAIKHRLYYCLTLILALAFSGDIYTYYKTRYTRLSAMLTIGVANLLLIAAIVLTGSRTMMLLIPVILLFQLIRYLKGKQLTYALISIGLVILATGVLFSRYNSRVSMTIERHQQLSLEAIRQHPLQYEPRLYLHSTALFHYQEYGIKGLGLGTAPDFMMKCFVEDNVPEVIQHAYGPHSQYFNLWIEMGPMALFLLIFILCYTPWFYRGSVRWDALYLSTAFGWAMLTETALSRVSGMYILTAMLVLLALEYRQQVTSHLAIGKA